MAEILPSLPEPNAATAADAYDLHEACLAICETHLSASHSDGIETECTFSIPYEDTRLQEVKPFFPALANWHSPRTNALDIIVSVVREERMIYAMLPGHLVSQVTLEHFMDRDDDRYVRQYREISATRQSTNVMDLYEISETHATEDVITTPDLFSSFKAPRHDFIRSVITLLGTVTLEDQLNVQERPY